MRAFLVALVCLSHFLLFFVTGEDQCDASNAASGTWRVQPTSRTMENGITKFCPNTFLEIDNNYQGSYICTGRPGAYHQATFNQDSCNVMDTKDSFKILKKHTIYFVGDSMMMQRWFAMKCIMEGRANEANVQIETKFLYSRFLDRDVACKHEPTSAGDDCKDDWLSTFNKETQHKSNPDVSLVVGAGGWFDGMSKIADHKVYKDVVEKYSEALGAFVKKGIPVIWMDLPPMIHDSSDKYWHQHSLFAAKNAIAKENMSKQGVMYLDTQKGIKSRRTQDPTVFADRAIHACNPGKNSIPIFLAKRILHLLAVEKEQAKKKQKL